MQEPAAKIDPNQILVQEINQLRQQLLASVMPEAVREKALRDILSLERSIQFGNYDEKYEIVTRYIDWLTKIPWNKETKDRLDIEETQKIFDSHHYGMQEVKDRFLEYVSILNLQQKQDPEKVFRAPILLLVGLVGTGKTTFAYSLAEALGRYIVRIPFGGMNSAKELRGWSRLHLEAEPGRVIKGIAEVGVRNPVILLDEIDRCTEESRMDIMGVLVELLDPAQNKAFTDNYVDYPVDLSHAIFLATANNTNNIATAVMDRMEKISMPSYSDHEKEMIAKKYTLPKLFANAGLNPEQIHIADDLWPLIIRPLGYDMGIRTLERNLDNLVRKAVRIMVERNYQEIWVNKDNAKIFLPQY
ncbi:MAG: AAA family ATPase [Candidatus Moranbacteria bacterium]|nr:AAA family ATPase [Candidatus Moranbacteria bacterium]